MMNLECGITALKTELNSKYKLVKSEEMLRLNEDEKRFELVRKIQLTVKELMEKIADNQSPAFNIIRANWENCIFDGRVQLKEKKRKTKRIDFKRKITRSHFAANVFLLSKIHKLLMLRQTSTRRCSSKYVLALGNNTGELYYENLKIFKSQKQVDNRMKEVCNLLNVPPWELGVFATSKGIVAGPVVFTLANGESVNCERRGGVNIPQNVLEIEKMSSSATWVLIIEKDASFQRLVTNEACNRLGSCILITGKGFPDVSSRILVCKIWELLRIPILVLVDADPYGFEIMCVYRFGSLSMSPHSKYLACPAVRWLGVHPSDIRPLFLDSSALSLADAKKIQSLLKRTYVKENEDLKNQLEILLKENVKCEIEGLANISTNYLTDVYMKNKIQCKEYL